MHEFTQGYLAHAPGWHQLGHVVDEYPGREAAIPLAGHDFEVVERQLIMAGTKPIAANMEDFGKFRKLFDKYGNLLVTDDGIFTTTGVEGFKALVKHMPHETRPTWLPDDAKWEPTHGTVFHVSTDSYAVVQNEVGWDIAEAMVGEGAELETALSLRKGAVCVVLMYLPEPYTVPGDDSQVLPFVAVSWTHDGSGAVRAEATQVRIVCMNTLKYSEMLTDKQNTAYTFRHSAHVMERIEEAKAAIRGEAKEAVKGTRRAQEVFIELTNELIQIKVNKRQRELFVTEFIPMPASDTMLTERKKLTVEENRALVRSILDGTASAQPTIPEAHRFTGYGLHLAGVEFLDHYRGTRASQEAMFNRQVLKTDTFKANLTDLIREVAKA